MDEAPDFRSGRGVAGARAPYEGAAWGSNVRSRVRRLSPCPARSEDGPEDAAEWVEPGAAAGARHSWFSLVVAAYLVTYVIEKVFHNELCGRVLHCGCTWEWVSGWDECNVHTGPHRCPWCLTTMLEFRLTQVPIFAAGMTAFLYSWVHTGPASGPWRYAHVAASTLAAWAAASTFVAFLFFLFTEYPFFLWIDQRRL